MNSISEQSLNSHLKFACVNAVIFCMCECEDVYCMLPGVHVCVLEIERGGVCMCVCVCVCVCVSVCVSVCE